MTNTQNSLGSFIVNRRYELRLTQEDLAKRLAELGLERTATTISAWENGRSPLPLELIEPLSKALEMASPALLYELAGLLDSIPGGEIVKLLKDSSQEEVDRAERIIRALLNENEPKKH
jgi:transcriptional regulator with XRE-family HTH domain